MRCPKCGYTSFDHLETCKKCHKSLADVTALLNGTTYEAIAPLFLKISSQLEQEVVPSTVQELDFEEFEEDVPAEEPVRQGIDTEFVLDAFPMGDASSDSAPHAKAQPEITVDFDEFPEASPRDAFTLDLEIKAGADGATMPPIDFADLDISDLAHPARTLPGDTSTPGLELDTESPAHDTTQAPTLNAPVAANMQSAAPAAGLEDLHFNGLDLESPAKIVTGSAAGKRYLPSVKTGTALDKFDIDLGELFATKKEKNN